MGWFRFDDKAIDHPKFLALSDGAFRLWIEGGSYCNRHLTDGLILRVALNGFRYITRKRVEELVKVVLWDEVSGGFLMHDYHHWNETAEEVKAKKQAAKARTRKWRDGVRDASQDAYVPYGVGNTSVESKEEEKKGDAFAIFWDAYPRHVGRAAAEKAFNRLKPSGPVLEAMLVAVAQQKRQPQWTKDGGQFIPHAATWINQRRWEDEATAPAQTSSYAPSAHADYDRWPEECRAQHGGTCGNYEIHRFRMAKSA